MTMFSSSIARPSFTLFHLSKPPSPPPQKLHLLKPHPTFPKPLHRPPTSIKSINVSDEEQSISLEEDPEPIIEENRKPDEKFAVINTGIYECRSCGYNYNQAIGDNAYPIPPGLPFDRLPEDWRCPTCGASQSFFQSKSLEIAGFAQNQQFGLGGNTLTSGQKSLLIYGGLLLGFGLFLSGYFLQ